MVDNMAVMQNHMEDYFRDLFREDRPLRPRVDGLHLPMLGDGQEEWLERPFEEEEIKKAVWLFDGDKAPRPDGFTIAFYKTCWEVIKGDLLLVFEDFYEKCFWMREVMPTYIALIP